MLKGFRIGEASHPGPDRMKAAAKTLVADGKEHVGDTFEAAFKDQVFVQKLVKKPQPKSANLRGLQSFFKARLAKQTLSRALSSGDAPPLPPPEQGGEQQSEGETNWQVVPFRPRRESGRSQQSYWPAFAWPLCPPFLKGLGRRVSKWRLTSGAAVLVCLCPHVLGVVTGVVIQRFIDNVIICAATVGGVLVDAFKRTLGVAWTGWVKLERDFADYLWDLFLLDKVPWLNQSVHYVDYEYYEFYEVYEYYYVASVMGQHDNESPPALDPPMVSIPQMFCAAVMCALSFVAGHGHTGVLGGPR